MPFAQGPQGDGSQVVDANGRQGAAEAPEGRTDGVTEKGRCESHAIESG